jgi:GntR family transcriptional regulator, transcriptional repressor for pyruvate dehydrogenase complex
VTIREALTALREQGRPPVPRRWQLRGRVSELLHDRLREVSPSELRDLADHYVAISGASALRAAYRAGEQKVALITATVSELECATDAARRRRAESRFQVELAAAAQSPRLTRATITLQSEVGPLLWLATASDADRAEVLRRHREILAAVVAGDGTRARSHAVAHIYAALARAIALQLTLLAEDEADSAPGETAAEGRAW